MKRLRKTILLTVFTLALCFGAGSPVHAETIRIDGYLLPEIPKPRGSATYDAELQVETQNGKIALKGTCSSEGELTDQERAQAVWDALYAVPEYDKVSDAAEEQKYVSDLTKKLKTDLEDPGRILNNFFKCAGIDKVTDLLQGKIPQYSWDDIVKMFIAAAQDKTAVEVFSPVPLGVGDAVSGAIIGTAKVSWAEYKNDQKRWKNIVDLANAKARLREYDMAVKVNLLKLAEKKMEWTIRIQDEYSQEILYDQMLNVEAPMIHSADILLKKSGDMSTPYGTYTGTIRYKGEMDLKRYDNRLPYYYSVFWDGFSGDSSYLGHYTGTGVKINRPSENVLILERTNFRYNMMEGDSFGGMFESPIDTSKMEVKDFHVLHDYVVTLQRKEPSGTRTVTYTNILDSKAAKDHKSWLVHYVTNTGETYDTKDQANNDYPETDPRKYLKLTLFIRKF